MMKNPSFCFKFYWLEAVVQLISEDIKESTFDSIIDPLITEDRYGADQNARDTYGTIRFPQNLYVVGTVNMDETTFPFSKKVLDRANTMEFNYVELVPKFEGTLSPVEPLEVPNRFLQTEYLVLERDCADE